MVLFAPNRCIKGHAPVSGQLCIGLNDRTAGQGEAKQQGRDREQGRAKEEERHPIIRMRAIRGCREGFKP